MKKILIITTVLFIISCSKEKSQVVNNDPFFTLGIKTISPPIKSPEFELKNIAGDTVTFSSFKGKVVILNFWAHWCAPCVQEMPSINSLYEKTRNMDIEVITINLGESQDIVEKYISENKFKFHSLLDKDKAVAANYGVRSIPSTYIINKNGDIIANKLGAMEWDTSEIINLLEEISK